MFDNFLLSLNGQIHQSRLRTEALRSIHARLVILPMLAILGGLHLLNPRKTEYLRHPIRAEIEVVFAQIIDE